jgi:putative ABC transport system permease protein
MITHICKLFMRNFRKNIVINLLNLIGLAAGLAACMMIIVYLYHEYSYDDYHEFGDRIVRVVTFQKVGEGQEIRVPSASYPVAEGLAAEIASVERFVRFQFAPKIRPVFVDDRIFYEGHLVWADSTLFDIFSYPLVRGNPRTALAASGNVVLAEATAKRFFGDDDPMGREIRLSEKSSYTVTGVMEDIQQPSHFPSFPMIMSMTSLDIPGPEYWVGRSGYGSYLLLNEGHTAEDVQPAADKVYHAHADELMKMMGAECEITLQPISEIHFDDGFDFDLDYRPAVTHKKIIVFALIAVFILIIASVNFVNMATARSAERAHQVGISKAVGASRRLLILQFLGESLLNALAAFALALLLVELFLPTFGGFVGRELSSVYSDRPIIIAAFLGLTAVVGVGAGLYPAFVLSSFQPSVTIHERFLTGSSRSRLRQVLIGFQFTVAILLIVSTLIVRNQLDYMDSRYPGFDREQLMVLNVGPDMTGQDCEMVRTEALRHPGVLTGTCSSFLPTMGHLEYTFRVPEEANCEMLMTRMFMVDPWFIETMRMELLSGRDFHREGPGDAGSTVIINETAARQLGWEDPVGRQLDAHPSTDSFKPMTIIGVVKDVNFDSYHHKIQPMTLVIEERTPAKIALRLRTGSVQEAIAHVRRIWEERFPRSPFRYRFLDETFAYMYEQEIRLGRLIAFYTTLAIVISCVGLLALIAFSTERRIREIGIRKVLGASPSNLFALLSNEYVWIVLIALAVAAPLARWLMQRWLENFAYRASIAWWLYAASGVLALVLALITAGAYTWRACQVNPADILRQE